MLSPGDMDTVCNLKTWASSCILNTSEKQVCNNTIHVMRYSRLEIRCKVICLGLTDSQIMCLIHSGPVVYLLQERTQTYWHQNPRNLILWHGIHQKTQKETLKWENSFCSRLKTRIWSYQSSSGSKLQSCLLDNFLIIGPGVIKEKQTLSQKTWVLVCTQSF